MDRSDLSAGEGDVRHLFGHAEPSFDASAFGDGKVAGDAVHVRVIDTVSGELIVGRDQLEYGRTLENEIRLVRCACRRCNQTTDQQHQRQSKYLPHDDPFFVSQNGEFEEIQ